jgi:hypothetical protein
MAAVSRGAEPRRNLARARFAGGSAVSRQRRISLCETLDRVLNKGAVVAGDIIISIAGIDLVYIGVNLVVASHDTMRAWSESSRVRERDRASAMACDAMGGA